MTVTWIQLNAQLLRLTGEQRFADELERSYYNHLAAAQRPDGAQWCYYTPLEGTKPYGPGINCCVSSGPRGMALLPQLTFLKRGRNTIVINLFESGTYTTTLSGQRVVIEQVSDFLKAGTSTLTIRAKKPPRLAIEIRNPEGDAPEARRAFGLGVLDDLEDDLVQPEERLPQRWSGLAGLAYPAQVEPAMPMK